MNKLLIFLCTICLFGCAKQIFYPSSKYKEKYTSETNINSSNMQIFNPNLKLEYQIVIEKNHKQCAYYAMPFAKDSAVVYDKIYSLICFDSVDKISNKNRISLLLEVSKFTSDKTTLDNKQILIEYHYINKTQDQVLAIEQTGLIDDSSHLFLHAPRGLFLGILGYTSHASLKHNRSYNQSWESNLYVYEKMMNEKEKQEYNFDECPFINSINSQSKINLYLPALKITKETILNNIVSTCDKSGFKTQTNYYFNKGIGLVKAEYIFETEVKVSLDLIKILEK